MSAHAVQTKSRSGREPSASALVVGVLGDAGSLEALDWAVEEALSSGSSLHLVHTRTASVPGSADAPWGAVGADVLARALERVGDRVRVTSECVDGSAARALVEGSIGAPLVVLGPPTHGPVGSALVGSTAVEVAAGAHCPVVVVRGRATARCVVAGVDGTEGGRRVLEAAFGRAERLGLSLRAVHVWPLPDIGFDYTTPEVEREIARQAVEDREHSARIVDEVAARHPDVDVSHEVLRSSPGRVLRDASRSAEMVVVGSRGRSEVAGLVLGSVSQSLLRHARCPVMVVPPAAGAGDE